MAVGTPSSHRTGPVAYAGVNTGAKQNPLPTSSTDAATAFGRQVDRHPQRLQHVRGAAGGRRGAVAVLDDGHAGGRDDDGGHR